LIKKPTTLYATRGYDLYLLYVRLNPPPGRDVMTSHPLGQNHSQVPGLGPQVSGSGPAPRTRTR